MGIFPDDKEDFMKRLFKKVTTFFLTAVMVFGMLPVNTFAAGTVTNEMYGSGSNTNITYSFDVDGNLDERDDNDAHCGQTSNKGFAISSSGLYNISFGGTAVGATIYIYKERTKTQVHKINIPAFQPGMPTLSSNYSFEPGQYYVKVVSASYTTYSTGSFTIKGVAGRYTHDIKG